MRLTTGGRAVFDRRSSTLFDQRLLELAVALDAVVTLLRVSAFARACGLNLCRVVARALRKDGRCAGCDSEARAGG